MALFNRSCAILKCHLRKTDIYNQRIFVQGHSEECATISRIADMSPGDISIQRSNSTRTLPSLDEDNRRLSQKLDSLISSKSEFNQEMAGEESVQNQGRHGLVY